MIQAIASCPPAAAALLCSPLHSTQHRAVRVKLRTCSACHQLARRACLEPIDEDRIAYRRIAIGSVAAMLTQALHPGTEFGVV